MHTDAANLHATAAVPEYHEHALPPGFILAFATHRPLLQSFVVGLVIVGMVLITTAIGAPLILASRRS
jgi:hypothetical protein